MRLLSLKLFLKEAYTNLDLGAEMLESDNNSKGRYYRLQFWQDVFNALNELESINYLKPYVQEIYDLGVQYQSPSNLIVSQSDLNRLQEKVDRLGKVLEHNALLLEEYVEDDLSDQINIKVNGDCSLSEYESIIKDLNFVFNQCAPINAFNKKNEVNIKKVDSGSIWLILSVSAVAIPLIGKLCKIALDCRE